MKKQQPSARDEQKSKQPQTPADKSDAAPEKVPDRDLIDDKHTSTTSSESKSGGPHNKRYEQQHEGIDQNVIPEQSGQKPGETKEDVEENSKKVRR